MSYKYILVKVSNPQDMAPCSPDGEVYTINETKEAVCECAIKRCLVDSRNRVLSEPRVDDWVIWPVEKK